MVFPKWMNHFPTASALGGGAAAMTAIGVVWYYFTPSYWEVGYEPIQPVEYSHQIHVGLLGMDCRYCHTDVEESPHANIPDSSTCMNCHTAGTKLADDGTYEFDPAQTFYLNSDLIAKHHANNPNLIRLRNAYAEGRPVEWRRVHKLPDYVMFNHAAHINAGVSCYSCHGRIDQQAVVRQEHPLSMGWCLECHRDPTDALIDTNEIRITDLGAVEAQLMSENQAERGRELQEQGVIVPSDSCGTCHY